MASYASPGAKTTMRLIAYFRSVTGENGRHFEPQFSAGNRTIGICRLGKEVAAQLS